MKNGTRRIALTQGKFAIVDAVDYDFLMQWKWYAQKINRCYYAARGTRISEGRKKSIYMHAAIAERAGLHFKEIDHRNRLGLDNRRDNLRRCTRSQNSANATKRANCSSKYKGVTWHKWAKRWFVRITVNYKVIHLGLFRKEIDAHRAYKAAAIHYFGEFACF